MVKGDPLLRERLAREDRGNTFPRFFSVQCLYLRLRWGRSMHKDKYMCHIYKCNPCPQLRYKVMLPWVH